MARIGLKVQDLYSTELSEKLDIILPIKNKTLKEVYGLKTYTKDEVLALCKNMQKFSDLMCVLIGKKFWKMQNELKNGSF